MPKGPPYTSLKVLVSLYGRDTRHWASYIEGMGLATYIGPKNSILIDAEGSAKIAARQRRKIKPRPMPA